MAGNREMKPTKKVGNFINGYEIFEALICKDDLFLEYHFDEYRRAHMFIRSPLVWYFNRMDKDWYLVPMGVTDLDG
jgi:hypothetical protein